jgi:peptidoglycan hydrolase FlgJ
MGVAQIEGATVANVPVTTRPTPPDETAVRRMAAQFEALLLNQLTASLNPPQEEEGEEGLFSNSGGLGLSRQMFSEQFAKTMAENGGIGLADMIVKQVKHNTAGALKGREGVRALATARALRSDRSATPATAAAATQANAGNEEYPDAIIISEANSPSSANANAVVKNDSVFQPAAASATRPRRVHPNNVAASPRTLNPIETNHENSIPLTTGAGVRTAMGSVSLHLPIRGSIRSEFGPRRDPINGRPRFHQGVDIAATRGTPIEAAAAGTVVFAGRNKGYGNMVMIEHADGRRTLYAHAERLFVHAGDTVTGGQTIAAVGSTGHSTGPHLHFEVREGNRALNPLSVLANDFTLVRR